MNKYINKFYFRMLRVKARSLLNTPQILPSYIRSYLNRSFLRSRQNVIVSYPKSGRTWLEQLLVHVIIEGYCLTDNGIEHFEDLLYTDNHVPYIILTHACSSWEDFCLFDENEILKVNYEKAAGERTLFLYRDPRDVLVSSYYHLRYRNGINWIAPSDMIFNPVFGLRKILRFMNIWLSYTQRNNYSLLLSYEKLQNDPFESLKKVCELFGLKIEKKTIYKAIDFCSFSAMQKREKDKIVKSPRLITINDKQPESRKVRQGKVGEHRDFFSKYELERIDQIISAELSPFFDYHPMRSSEHR